MAYRRASLEELTEAYKKNMDNASVHTTPMNGRIAALQQEENRKLKAEIEELKRKHSEELARISAELKPVMEQQQKMMETMMTQSDLLRLRDKIRRDR